MSSPSLGTLDALSKVYGCDADLEANGVWIQVQLDLLPPGRQHPEFLVARQNKSNRKYVAMAQAQAKRLGRKVDLGLIKPEELTKSNLILFVLSCIKDWRHIYDAAGNLVAYDSDLCRRFFEANDDVYTYLNSESQSNARYQIRDAEAIETVVGESAIISAGN